MNRVDTYGKVENGKLRISYRERFIEQFTDWTDCRVILTVEKIYKHRSLEQNAYIHGVLFPEITKGLHEAGWSKAEINEATVKDFLKRLFLTQELTNEKTGETMTLIKGTSDLSTSEMADFVDNCVRWASQNLSITIPLPGEQMEAL